ncbi:D-alanyl-D-alanine carboxypeptidase (penicillin-binding protein 5/6) [Fulvimarina manganoxydans]|uniref:serine-type D-Ala-D-Ala carboxypeptidase n=1 Tax=Fulvimarina manganoxydans TaxID=937218 RepID=A0A1W2E2J4_9HYPH|nr:D-alanyl-D-alanine carboxypeptidase (penicillin-binding protein 5/6) [Fulvimarina manganoxydans]
MSSCPVHCSKSRLARAACLGGLALFVIASSSKAQDAAQASAYGLTTEAPRALFVEDRTGTVILSKNAAEPFPPASLAKLMTMEIVFEAIESGEISLASEYPVSEHAWRTGGAPSGTSTMFAAIKSSVPVSALIRGTIIQAANDGAIILAEGLEGSEEAFAKRMNDRAAELGLKDSHFVNPTGLPAEGQKTSARDLVTLARHLREAHPDLYKIFAEPAFEWNGIFQRNRNPVLAETIGGEGIGTGYTENSGYSLMAVVSRGDRLFYLALSGLPSGAEREAEARRLLDFGFDGLVETDILSAGAVVASVPVFNGAGESVSVRVDRPVRILLPEASLGDVEARIRFEGPLIAPVEDGDEVGVLDIQVADETVYSQTVYASGSVPVGSFTDRAVGAMEELALGWTRSF